MSMWRMFYITVITLAVLCGLVMLKSKGNTLGGQGAAQEPAQQSAESIVMDTTLANATVKSLNGKPISIKSYRGKWLLLNVWATWCPPCRAEMPDLETIWKTQHPAGLEMLGISSENATDIWMFVTHQTGQRQVTYPMAQDTDGALSQALQITSIPRTLILDPRGHVVFDQDGASNRETFLDALKAAGFPVR